MNAKISQHLFGISLDTGMFPAAKINQVVILSVK